MTTERTRANTVLAANTLAFTVCFAAWMMNGVLITFLVENAVFRFSKTQIGWLIGMPVLTGSILRLPVGLLTDKYGGRPIYTALLLFSSAALFATAEANSYGQFLLAALAFGTAGASFAIGIAYTSVWFPKERQGTALGIFGVGNAGSALTSMGAPILLQTLTDHGRNLEGWRNLPRIYGGVILVTAVLFWLVTTNRKPAGESKPLAAHLAPLKVARVWRFGLYYFFVFGGFVALAQWMIPYYVNAYAMSIATAGLMAAIFSLPSGLIRALGGWMSDRWGARAVMYWVMGTSMICCLLLFAPRMEITPPGAGIIAPRPGRIAAVTDTEIVLATKAGDLRFPMIAKDVARLALPKDEGMVVLPRTTAWQEPVVEAGQGGARKQLLARGLTHIFFQANVWIFTAIVFALGIAMGIGKAAVYKHIPDYFPEDVGTVGGLVGVIGGLGGFVCPIVFGYLLEWTGLWTSCWVFFFVLVVLSLAWMHYVIRRMMRATAPQIMREIDDRLNRVSA